MTCVSTKHTQTIWVCISGSMHHGIERLWECSGTSSGIPFSWTEWRFEPPWVGTSTPCGGAHTDTPLADTQVALMGSQMQPTLQRLHRYGVVLSGLGPQIWLGWVTEEPSVRPPDRAPPTVLLHGRP